MSALQTSARLIHFTCTIIAICILLMPDIDVLDALYSAFRISMSGIAYLTTMCSFNYLLLTLEAIKHVVFREYSNWKIPITEQI